MAISSRTSLAASRTLGSFASLATRDSSSNASLAWSSRLRFSLRSATSRAVGSLAWPLGLPLSSLATPVSLGCSGGASLACAGLALGLLAARLAGCLRNVLRIRLVAGLHLALGAPSSVPLACAWGGSACFPSLGSPAWALLLPAPPLSFAWACWPLAPSFGAGLALGFGVLIVGATLVVLGVGRRRVAGAVLVLRRRVLPFPRAAFLAIAGLLRAFLRSLILGLTGLLLGLLLLGAALVGLIVLAVIPLGAGLGLLLLSRSLGLGWFFLAGFVLRPLVLGLARLLPLLGVRLAFVLLRARLVGVGGLGVLVLGRLFLSAPSPGFCSDLAGSSGFASPFFLSCSCFSSSFLSSSCFFSRSVCSCALFFRFLFFLLRGFRLFLFLVVAILVFLLELFFLLLVVLLLLLLGLLAVLLLFFLVLGRLLDGDLVRLALAEVALLVGEVGIVGRLEPVLQDHAGLERERSPPLNLERFQADDIHVVDLLRVGAVLELQRLAFGENLGSEGWTLLAFQDLPAQGEVLDAEMHPGSCPLQLQGAVGRKLDVLGRPGEDHARRCVFQHFKQIRARSMLSSPSLEMNTTRKVPLRSRVNFARRDFASSARTSAGMTVREGAGDFDDDLGLAQRAVGADEQRHFGAAGLQDARNDGVVVGEIHLVVLQLPVGPVVVGHLEAIGLRQRLDPHLVFLGFVVAGGDLVPEAVLHLIGGQGSAPGPSTPSSMGRGTKGSLCW